MHDGKTKACRECLDKEKGYNKKRLLARISQGLCSRCGKNPLKRGTNECEECLNNRIIGNRKLSKKKQSMGVCDRCGKVPPEKDKKKCQNCLDVISLSKEKRYQKRIKNGMCVLCNKRKFKINDIRCYQCIQDIKDAAAKVKADRIGKGLCYRCGKNPIDKSSKCNRCLKISFNAKKDRKEFLIIHNLCILCGKIPPRRGVQTCQRCFDYRHTPELKIHYAIAWRLWYLLSNDIKASKNGVTSDYLDFSYKEIVVFLESKFEGEYSWDTYGGNTGWALDHIIPISIYSILNKDGEINLIELNKCWNPRNLRPLWKPLNSSKSDKLIPSLIREYGIEDLLPAGVILDD